MCNLHKIGKYGNREKSGKLEFLHSQYDTQSSTTPRNNSSKYYKYVNAIMRTIIFLSNN